MGGGWCWGGEDTGGGLCWGGEDTGGFDGLVWP
jgi:hypothetical protein